MANFVGIAVARNAKAEINIREEGVGAVPRQMVMYASDQVHSCSQKAAELLGLGRKALRLVPTNEYHQIDLEKLQAAIAQDRAEGHYPFCIIGNAGTVNIGGFDDLNALADLAQAENMWFHVDGAFGAFVAITEAYAHLAAGMNRADSIAFDLHKWMYMPIEIGCTLVRDQDAHYEAFTLTPIYLTHGTRGASAGERWFSDYGLQLSRGFRALKAWMSIKHHGFKKYQRLIQQNIEQVMYLSRLVEATPQLELTAPTISNIVCFRYVIDGWSTERLNTLNQNIMYELHERGIAVPSYTTLNGVYALRVANVNHRSRLEDFDALVTAVVNIGQELSA
jgi:glutamate/tyrosine decarboxylase-like PLP-dependent enzyme